MSWGNPQTFNEHLFVKLLWLATKVYQLLLYFHQLAYKNNWLKSSKLARPVISIGNLTVGGTGKTPILVDLASRLLTDNINIAILSRGYKRSSHEPSVVAGDGQGNFASVESAGDESLMMAKMLPKAVVVVGKDRYLSGQMAIENYGSNLLLLDDGFQHWVLKRDNNIVLLDYEDNLERDYLLPAGRLREPLSALARANNVIITKIPRQYDQKKIDDLKSLVDKYNTHCKISLAQFLPSSVHQLIAGKWTEVALEKLSNLPVVAFCGLAKSNQFFDSVNKLGANLLGKIPFADHHYYSAQDIAMLEKQLNNTGAEYLVTTRKDLVKVENSLLSARLLAINMKVNWLSEAPNLRAFVKESSMHAR